MAGGRIKGITIELNGDSTKLEASLKSVNSEIKNTESKLKDVNKLLKMDPGNTNLLSQKYKTLQQEIQATKQKLDTLKEASKQADQALKDGTISKEQYDALQREIAETEQKLKGLEQEYKNFGSVQAQQVAAAGEKMKELGGKMESAGKTLTTHVTLPLAAVGAAGVASFAEVDKTMQLTNKTMGNTEEQAQLLNKAMKDAAANSTFGMKDAATATLNFARAGLDAEQAAAALAPAMNLAAGEGGNLDTVSGGLVATINGFHGSFEDAGKYADVFAAACNNSALDVDSLSHAMSVAAPIFSSAGYSVNDAALYMGIMANNGIDADKAANSLKTGLARLVSPAKEGAEMMDKLGISVTNSDGTMKSSIQIQKELHDAFGKLSESEQIAAASAIFGKNQMAPWLALINTAPEDVGELDTSLRNCAGTTDEMAEAMMSGFGGSLEKLKSSIDVLVTSIGEALAPTILKVATFIQNLVDKFNALTPAQQQVIVKIGLVVAAIGPLLVIIGKLLTSVGTIMTWAPKIVNGVSSIMGIGSKLMGGLQALWGVIIANPITLIVAKAAHWMDNGSVTDAILAGVKDVLVNGNRTLPLYVDEHDCFSDIQSISTGSVKDRKAYVQGKTVVKNKYGSTWTFWCFPDSTSDPFGYTAAAYKAATGEEQKEPEKSSKFPFLVRISISDLNYRKGPGTSHASYGYIEPGVYTIVDEQDGWGLLKAYAEKRNGWVKLSYTEKV